jgi:hypothetical protein
MKIFNILIDLCQEQALYIDSFVELLKNCLQPFLLDKSTDAEIYSSALIAFYSDFGRKNIFSFFSKRKHFYLGYLLRISNKRIQQCILDILYKSIQPTNKSPIAEDDYDGLRPIKIDYLLRMQCNSDLCETLVKVMKKILYL